jgi:hypothetical protein
MSLTGLVDAELLRGGRSHLRPLAIKYADKLIPKFQIALNQKDALTDELMPLAAEAPDIPTKTSNVLDALTKYIPTEVIALYIAACSTMAALKTPIPTQKLVYWIFIGCTPVLFMLLLAGKRRQAHLPVFPPVENFWKNWPLWKLCASAAAFGAWALAVPTTPYLTDEGGRILATFVGLVVSTLLNMLGAIIQPEG